MPTGIDAFKETKKGEALSYQVSSEFVGTLAPHRAVIIDATGTNVRPVTYATVATVSALGLVGKNGGVAGDVVDVHRSGVAIGISGEEIALGAQVTVGADGKLFVAGAGEIAIGRAEQATAGADEEFAVALDLFQSN